MNSSQLSQFKQQLLDLKVELEALESIAKESGKTVELDQCAVGRLSRMDAMQGQQMALASERRRKVHLVQIEAALKRIENDDFGFCNACDEAIPMGRLEFDPTMMRCIKCAD